MLLPIPAGVSQQELSAWHYDSCQQLAYVGAQPIVGAVALLIELPQEIVFGQPEMVSDVVALVKVFLLREKFIDHPASLADVCIRQGEHAGIFVSFAPFGQDAFSDEVAA